MEEAETMSNVPRDPSQNTIQQQKQENESRDSQNGGYDVEFEDGRYSSPDMQQTPEQGHSGSYETDNTAGYGTGGTTVDQLRYANERSTTPPDPEAGQGQGGQ
jgi:hypothetical protein